MEDPARNRLRTMLGELLDHMEGAQFSGVYHRPPDEVAAQIFADRERERERWLEDRWK